MDMVYTHLKLYYYKNTKVVILVIMDMVYTDQMSKRYIPML